MASRFMRFIQTILPVFFLFSPGALRASSEEVPRVRTDFGYASRYVFRGIERAAESAQATVEFNREAFRASMGTNQPLRHGDARELSLNAGYAWEPTDELTVEASATHTWFGKVPGGGVEKSFELGLVATLAPIQGFTPSLGYHHDFNFRADSTEASLAHSIALPQLGAFLELNIFAGWVSGSDWRPEAAGPHRQDDYGYWGGEMSLPYRIGAYSTLVAGIHYADSFGRSVVNGAFGRGSTSNLWFSVGVNLDF